MHIPITLAQAQLRQADTLFKTLYSHGSLSIEIYKPDQFDLQKPHDRDEVYIIVSGSGKFKNGDETINFAPNDFLFVPVGVEHRFIDFTGDFLTWVIFYGPVGGEQAGV